MALQIGIVLLTDMHDNEENLGPCSASKLLLAVHSAHVHALGLTIIS